MTWDWQDVVALALVGVALVYLVRCVWGAFARKTAGGCATGCGGCPSRGGTSPGSRSTGTDSMVPIEALTRPSPRS